MGITSITSVVEQQHRPRRPKGKALPTLVFDSMTATLRFFDVRRLLRLELIPLSLLLESLQGLLVGHLLTVVLGHGRAPFWSGGYRGGDANAAPSYRLVEWRAKRRLPRRSWRRCCRDGRSQHPRQPPIELVRERTLTSLKLTRGHAFQQPAVAQDRTGQSGELSPVVVDGSHGDMTEAHDQKEDDGRQEPQDECDNTAHDVLSEGLRSRPSVPCRWVRLRPEGRPIGSRSRRPPS